VPIAAFWMSFTVAPSPGPGASSGSSLTTDASVTVGGPHASLAVTDASTVDIRWFGGHKRSGVNATEIVGGVTSTTVAVQTATVVSLEVEHETVTSEVPSA
jgi:hypothetical protein